MLLFNKIYITIIAILLPGLILAQNNNNIVIEKNDIRKYGDSIYIDYNIIIKNINVESDRYLTLTPVISTQNQSQELKNVIINGKSKHKLYKRAVSLNYQDDNYRVLSAVDCEKGVVIPYKTSVAYQTWMKNAKVELIEALCDCGGKSSEKRTLAVANNIDDIVPVPFPRLATTYIAAQKEEVKTRELSGEAFVVFPVSKYDLIPDLGENILELSKISKSIDYVNDVPNVKITRIMIEAYASPEGNEQSNLTLSHNRAIALKGHIQAIYKDLGDGIFTTRSKGENWEGLNISLDALSLTEKQKTDIRDILKIDDVNIRKNKLRSYEKGQPYSYLLSNIYPQLRRSEYRIEYTIPVYTIDEAKELLKTKPGVLSLNELYQIANSYEKGSTEFKEIFDVAVRLYPNDVVAKMNAAAIELDANNVEKAEKYLSSNLNNVQSYNNIGVMYALKRDLTKAIYYFNKATENGDDAAAENLKKIEEYQNKTSNIKKH